MSTTRKSDCTSQATLLMAMELSEKKWGLFFGTGLSSKPHIRWIPARDLDRLQKAVVAARARLKLAADAPVVSCYEAGRDGFWLHRYLERGGLRNLVVDSASIEVNRRQRRAKTDHVDGNKLLSMLARHLQGEQKVWSVVRVPMQEEEDLRHLSREMDSLNKERKIHLCRIRSLLILEGMTVSTMAKLPQRLEALVRHDGSGLPQTLRQRLTREWERLRLVEQHISQLKRERRKLLQVDQRPLMRKVQTLQKLRGIRESSWTFVTECFGWREYRNRRAAAGILGLCPSPYQSGDLDHQQGISKAGNRRARAMAVEITWSWLRFQPQSELSQWFHRRFGRASRRQRRVGIVAMARKLMVLLWRYLETGELPRGAVLSG
jgi:transposase